MIKVFSEVGFGNESFFSTELENFKGEKRIKVFILPEKIQQFYLRIWIFKIVLIISFFKGIFFKKKKENRFKILLGVGGFSE